MAEARKNPQFASLFSSFRANVPQLYANLDRTKAKQQNVPVTSVFQALQVQLPDPFPPTAGIAHQARITEGMEVPGDRLARDAGAFGETRN